LSINQVLEIYVVVSDLVFHFSDRIDEFNYGKVEKLIFFIINIVL